ncbi:hypothetical protein MPSEU_000556400 [Mayamaea pseudoterrestris]|nr:hypothetical protein MPSEU_000556400 [Mayamaea pseudoterrestris]
MKLALAASLIASAAAFAPSKNGQSNMQLDSAKSMNGWSPDNNVFAYGLPGAIDPIPEGFDPLGFAQTASLEKMKEYREAELQHGRVAMLATVGMLVTEQPLKFHPLFGSAARDIGPSIRHLDVVRQAAPFFFEILAFTIGTLELNRALRGWRAPSNALDSGKFLNPDYYPGDVGFDPFGLKPTDPAEFAEMQTKELQNGRLAMLGAAGIVAQELVNEKEIFVNLGVVADHVDAVTSQL